MKKALLVLVLSLLVVFSFGKTKITFWGFMLDDESSAKILNDFMKENPDIEVEYVQLSWSNGFDKIVTAIAANNAPDVVELGNTWVANFASQKTITNLDNYADVEKYFGWDSVKYDGHIWAMPWLLGTRALFFNLDLFEKAGLDPNNPPETWEELYVAAKKINEVGDNIYGFGMCAGENFSPWQQWFLPAVWGNGGDIIVDDKSQLYSTKVIETAEFYKALSKYSLKTKQADLAKAFGEGKIGMYVSGAWDIDGIEKNYPNIVFDVTLLPKPNKWSGTHASFAGAEVLAITEQSKNKEAAIKLIKYLLRSDVAMQVTKLVPSVFPSVVGADKDPWFDDHPLHKTFYEQNKYAKPAPSNPQWFKIQQYLTEAIEKIILENEDIDSTLRYYNLKIQQLLNH
ncbi:extracellular solute-binding protein [Marinitoga sp. 38H-ov]|uniref:extracellular solute-binding protein n=1 Tax=Marinitoga sp. 38H-ov TaxID=1755814 RepID=UPI0013ECF419|nr:extracellular solute-binding protein [Marinitoga sp. 38H-ov]KAF2956135.1 ABC transporter substrate-binding protein [Marinitoga sp. 38H-ov]